MAPAKRIPNDFGGGRTWQGQRQEKAQVAKIVIARFSPLLKLCLLLAVLVPFVGCQSSSNGNRLVLPNWMAAIAGPSESVSDLHAEAAGDSKDTSDANDIAQVSYYQEDANAGESVTAIDDELVVDDDNSNSKEQEREPADGSSTVGVVDVPFEDGNSLELMTVIRSTVNCYPEIEAVMREIGIAEGEVITAEGGFDTKLKIGSESTPVGFYETFRNRFGLEQPTFNGGSLFAGYRFGRGDMEPWYLERNTNAGGELSLGAGWALLRGRDVDARRVALWKANLNLRAAEPAIRFQLLLACRDAQLAYWNWVAAGQLYRLNKRLLDIARDRVDGIEARIEADDLAEIARTDNDRTILSREVKLTKARAKLEQAAIKLSLYYRDANGIPLIPVASQIPDIETMVAVLDQAVEGLVAEALSCRPELQTIDLEIRKVRLDIAKARNDLLPSLNARVAVSQDFGRPTSASAAASSSGTVFANFDEKDEFQVDAGLFLGQDLQRRKASGKIRSLCNKLQQLQIKSQFLQQKIEAEVRQNFQLTAAAAQQIDQAQRSRKLAEKLAQAARERYVEGDVDLFEIILREGQELDAANSVVEALFSFHANRANLNASVGCDEYQLFNAVLQN